MAGRLTLWGASQMLQSFFGKNVTAPNSFYMAMIRLTPPSLFSSGDELDEPEDPAYLRVEIPNDVGYWTTDAQPHLITLSQSIAFPTATTDWGRLRFWALCDSPSSGDIYFVGDISDQTLNVLTGQTLTINGGDLLVSLGPLFTVESS